ncbi:peptidase M20/M25/M40 family protein [Chlamydia ibidis]|uniref:Peptidase M20/M25/M40 family protein n=2 Tax=Chlamydia ibidis TaxID=1405396 RepID=S7J208_9CHLA|nr:M20/M25/M40 family metallo-hydrolase [Chlamydia ibidis]EPP34459.1 peptidase M20/M25/M40 family protein [Chlamydia ibidis]EQM62474.1 peptidase M20/M25/M40 family protein [Chlamydia ibidis 10-1398/6]
MPKLSHFDKELNSFLQEFSDFINFPSISANPENLKDCNLCALFLIEKLKTIFSIELWEKPNHPPIIFAQYKNKNPSSPTLLIYNHYDVQPANLEDGWEDDPFSLREKDGKLFARGVSDNKGQCFYTWKALQYYYQSRGGFPVNITWIIEGEEESGSEALRYFIEDKNPVLRSDYVLIVDGGFTSAQCPSISIGARGLLTLKITLKEGESDMHSGTFGGIAYNVNRALVELLASFHNENNEISVNHFYDDVSLPENYKITNQNYTDHTWGFAPVLYPPAKTPKEASTIYPTIEINGISGGYTGPGFKTVIPCQATAFLSCRLVPNQNPEKITKAITEHLIQHTPKQVQLSYEFCQGNPGWRSSGNLPIANILREVYSELYGISCHEAFMEGTIPIATLLREASQAEPIICGTSYLTDNIHAAEENFSIDQMRKGFLSVYLILDKLAKQ